MNDTAADAQHLQLFHLAATVGPDTTEPTVNLEAQQTNTSAAAAVAAIAAAASHNQTAPTLVDAFTSYLYTQTKETLEHLLIAVLVYAIVCLGVYKLLHLHRRQPHWPPPPPTPHDADTDDAGRTPPGHRPPSTNRAVRFPAVRRVLLVTAHPDDESMFFGPTLLALARRRRRCQVYVLCLSNGNYDQLGAVRRDELWRACAMLRVPAARITLVQATQLADDPQLVWRSEVVAKLVLQHVEALGCDAVCTFDRDGVSQHANHRAIYYATASLLLAGLLPARCRVLTLDTTSVLRKYVGVFDLLLTLLLGSYWCVASMADVRIVRRAMAEHRSQMVWFRRLYVLCSRYMWINSWRQISRSDVELEMQIDEGET